MKRQFGCEHNAGSAWNTEVNWAKQINKEKVDRVLSHKLGQSPPMAGARVMLANMQHRPELNGLEGQVILDDPDEHGYLTVKVEGKERGRRMKVHPARLYLVSDKGPDMTKTVSYEFPIGSAAHVLKFSASPVPSGLDGAYTDSAASTRPPSEVGSVFGGRAASSAGSRGSRRGGALSATGSCPVLPSLPERAMNTSGVFKNTSLVPYQTNTTLRGGPSGSAGLAWFDNPNSR